MCVRLLALLFLAPFLLTLTATASAADIEILHLPEGRVLRLNGERAIAYSEEQFAELVALDRSYTLSLQRIQDLEVLADLQERRYVQTEALTEQLQLTLLEERAMTDKILRTSEELVRQAVRAEKRQRRQTRAVIITSALVGAAILGVALR